MICKNIRFIFDEQIGSYLLFSSKITEPQDCITVLDESKPNKPQLLDAKDRITFISHYLLEMHPGNRFVTENGSVFSMALAGKHSQRLRPLVRERI
jgi:hypothetical protein